MASTEESIPPQPPIIDSHIHLYPASEVSTLAWCTPTNALWGQESVDEYSAASLPSPLTGFIFIEAYRKYDLEAGTRDGSGWEFPLMEVSWMARIALGRPRDGEGHSAGQKELCLGLVPWAPLPSGVEALERYVGMVMERVGEAKGLVKGFRYLVQQQPKGVQVEDGFVEGLRWLGRRGYVFDVGVDHHRDGDWQMGECVEMMTRAHEGVEEKDKVTFILNHLCKPDMMFATQGDVQENPQFAAWRTWMYELSRFPKTYMKLSGSFSEMPAELKAKSADEIFEQIQPWLAVILATFGPARTMFGSDWPVCTLGTEEGEEAVGGRWRKWRAVVQRMCQLGGLQPAEQAMLWSGTAIKAYGLTDLK